MPIFTPGRRWQPAYSAFKHETPGKSLLAFAERVTKVRSLDAGCAVTACCRKLPSSAQWNVPKDYATDHAVVPLPEACYVDKITPLHLVQDL